MPKTVMITGAGSGFGKGASLALAGRGHRVIATSETDAQAAALRAEAPQLTVEKLDITSADSMMGQQLPANVRIEARVDSDGDPLTRSPGDLSAAQDGVALGSTVSLSLR